MVQRKKRVLKAKRDKLVLPTVSKGIDPAGIYSAMIYGPEGIGKTTFGSQAEDPFFIATEAGQKFVDVKVEPSEDWDKFREIVAAIDGMTYGTVVIDTTENAFDQCQLWVCDKLGIDHPSDEDFGKGYQAVRVEFYQQINRLALGDRRLLLISHEQTRDIKGRVVKTQKVVPSLTNTARRVVLPMVDIIGHCGFKLDRTGEPTSKRIIEFEPSELTEAKDRTGLLPKSMPLAYANFARALSGKSDIRERPKLSRRPRRR